MRVSRNYLLCLVILLSATWVAAQTSSQTETSNSGTAQNTGSSSAGSSAPGTLSEGTNSTQITTITTQTNVGKTSKTTSDRASGETTGGNTIEGCIYGASSFTLTDDSGNAYLLQGNTSSLGTYTGQRVQVTGSEAFSGSGTNPSDSSGMTASAMPGTRSGPRQFNVIEVKKVSDTCTRPNTRGKLSQ